MRQDGASELRDEILTGFCQLKIAFISKTFARKQTRGTKWRG